MIMAFDEHLAERVRNYLKEKKVLSTEKHMMGGLCILVNNKMLVAILKDMLMARVGPEKYAEYKAAKTKGIDFKRRQMNGFLFIKPEGTDLDSQLEYWLDLSLDFNPRAKATKKK
jgi:hypothetical protein